MRKRGKIDYQRNNNLVSIIKTEMVYFCLIDIQMENMRLLFIGKYMRFILWSSLQIFIQKYYLDIHTDTIHFLKERIGYDGHMYIRCK